ncbi:endophilin-A3 [Camelus ferus]|nr:endophilin-A3 [Camelus ferus]
MLNTVSKIRGQVKTTGYPQTEGLLGDCMLKYGKELGEGSAFGNALIEVGESMKLMAEVKDSLDINVKQTFIDPLQLLQDKDLKEIGGLDPHLRRQPGEPATERGGDQKDELVEQVSQLAVFIEAALDYHKQTTEILQELQNKLQMRISAASNVPKREYKPRPIKRSPSELNGVSTTPSAKTTGNGDALLSEMNWFLVFWVVAFLVALFQAELSEPLLPGEGLDRHSRAESPDKKSHGPRGAARGEATSTAPMRQGSNIAMDQPCCRGLYDFEPENQGELGFKEGDIITLTNQIDENWYEGMLHGESGFFPINYVEVIVPLPQ